jgi:hypothetical protein
MDLKDIKVHYIHLDQDRFQQREDLVNTAVNLPVP